MPEFTGERVIPDLVDPDLFNEHVARYRFAARFAEGKHILDAGCGSGYGTAEFSGAASVTATDISAEALAYARANFARPGVRFVKAACEALPFADATFELITAFEVIEHLERWQDLLAEAKRVLKPGGLLLVSTPNKSYYAEMRGEAGPNPFHCHEFEYQEFQTALYGVFPHVRIWSQNHADTIMFAPLNPDRAVLEARGDPAPETAHFFVAACSQSEIEAGDVFAWMPSTGNVLRDRERHIAKLKTELASKDAWLEDLKFRHEALQRSHEAALAEVNERSHWGQQLTARIREHEALIGTLQNEAGECLAWVRNLEAQLEQAAAEIQRVTVREAELETEIAARTGWARSLDAQLDSYRQHFLLQERQIEKCTAEIADRQTRLEDLGRQVENLRERQALIAASKWVRLGRSLSLGPAVDAE